MKFTQKENEVLSETFRRLCQFHNGDVDTTLLVLDTPSSVKTLIKSKVLRRALEYLPTEVEIWKELVQLDNEDEAKILLQKARKTYQAYKWAIHSRKNYSSKPPWNWQIPTLS